MENAGFMFKDEFIDVTIDGIRLQLKEKFMSAKLGEQTIRSPIAGGTEVKEIVSSSKRGFAEVVVPTLPHGAFTPFEPLFSLIEAIISGEI